MAWDLVIMLTDAADCGCIPANEQIMVRCWKIDLDAGITLTSTAILLRAGSSCRPAAGF